METIPRVQHDTDLLRTITKPIDDIDKLIRCLAPKCNQMLMDGRRNIGIVKENQHQCLVLFRGTMSLYRNNDGLIINSETSPFIFGMNSQLRYSRHIYLRTQETSSIGLISIKRRIRSSPNSNYGKMSHDFWNIRRQKSTPTALRFLNFPVMKLSFISL